MHTIYDEYIGYGYVVNQAFKPVKSHAAEVELLCTYAPNNECGEEGNIPYIAVQTDDEVYFYGFELEGEEYWDKAGLCLVYSKEYIGTEEEKLMNILDEVAKSFSKRQL